jgi:hypothetical protein
MTEDVQPHETLNTQRQKPEKPWLLDAAFVVPLSIFIGYFWALALTVGEYVYFNIPYNFISLNPTTVLASSAPLLIGIAFVLLCFRVRFLLVYAAEKYFLLRYLIFVCGVVLCISYVIDTVFNPEKTLLWSLRVGLVVYVAVIAFVCMDGTRARREPIRKERLSNSLPSTQLWNYLAIIIPLIAIGGFFLSYYVGKSSAETRDTFYLVKQSGGGKEDSELVFVGTYGDYLVVVPFRRDTKKFDSFMIVKMPQGDNTRLTFTREQVGRLERVQGKPAEVKP